MKIVIKYYSSEYWGNAHTDLSISHPVAVWLHIVIQLQLTNDSDNPKGR